MRAAGSPIRRSAGRRLLPPRRSLSQVAASFIVSLCQGIRRTPYVTFSRRSMAPRHIWFSLDRLPPPPLPGRGRTRISHCVCICISAFILIDNALLAPCLPAGGGCVVSGQTWQGPGRPEAARALCTRFVRKDLPGADGFRRRRGPYYSSYIADIRFSRSARICVRRGSWSLKTGSARRASIAPGSAVPRRGRGPPCCSP